nr:sugar ABC transporter substrate-binding protein [uncultured Dysosmobacter sp.]
MKKLFALSLALVMTLSLAACGGKKTEAPADTENKAETETPTTGDVKVAVVLKTLASEYWGYVEAGCKAAADDLGVKVVVVGPGAESDIEGQVSMIEQQQIGAGCDAIIVAPNDAGAASGALASAIGSIPVLSVDTNVGIEGQTSFVGTSNVDAAKEGGLWAAEQAGEGANAVIIYGQEGDNTSNMRREGYQAACDEAGVTVLDALSGQNTTDGATKTMEDLLNAYPDQIDIVLCHNDDTAIGAMNACKSAGVSDITIVGFDGNASAVKLILDGELVKATVAQQPYEMGYQVVEAAVKAVKGESVDEVINAPVQVVTAENGQAYLDNLEAMKG